MPPSPPRVPRTTPGSRVCSSACTAFAVSSSTNRPIPGGKSANSGANESVCEYTSAICSAPVPRRTPDTIVLKGCAKGLISSDQSIPSSRVTLRDTSEITASRLTWTGLSSETASTTCVSPATDRTARITSSACDGLFASPATNSVLPTESTRMLASSPTIRATTACASSDCWVRTSMWYVPNNRLSASYTSRRVIPAE